MKKRILLILLLFAILACNHSDDDNPKNISEMFLPTILSTDGQILTLTFDNKSRIVQLGEVANNSEFARLYTFNYTGERLTSAEAVYFSVAVEGGYNYTEKFKFEYVQNKVLVEKIFLDSSGYGLTTNNVLNVDSNSNLLSADGLELFYDNKGNIIKVIDNGNITQITYDDKKGSFINVKTPQWALYYVMQVGNFYRVNNPVQIIGYPVGRNTQIKIQREFEYNQFGFPIRFVQKTTETDGNEFYDNFFIDYLRLYND